MRLLQSAVILLTVCCSNVQGCDFVQYPTFGHRIKKCWLNCNRAVCKVLGGTEHWYGDFLVETLHRL